MFSHNKTVILYSDYHNSTNAANKRADRCRQQDARYNKGADTYVSLCSMPQDT